MEKNVLLVSTASAVETSMIVDVLSQNKIRSFTRPRRPEEVISAYTGTSVYGDDIFVAEEELSAARDAVEGMIPDRDNRD